MNLPARRNTDPERAGAGPLSRAFDAVERFTERHFSRALRFFEGRAVDVILRRLETELENYELRVPNNMANLMDVVRPADVILVEGRRRISFVVQKITSSPWSHACLYIGNGQLVEAENYGVIVSPIMKFAEHNIRLCVPRHLDEEKRALVVEQVKEAVGRSYDVANLRNLLISYLGSQRDRHQFLGNLEECQEMCSGLIARAFASVGYPVFAGKNHSQIVPRDFDLSPNFDIVKFNRMLPVKSLPTPQEQN